MNPDEYDFLRHLPREPSNVALDLLRGLEDRTFSHLKKNVKAKESREIFAEDELVRKKYYDEMRCEVPGQPRSTFLMVFSPDGSKVASTHGNHNIYVTDIKSGKNIKTLIGHPRTPWCIAFHPTSNQIVASGCLGGEVRIWDLSGGSEVWTAGNQSVIASIAFHPNDRVLVIATYNELYFWDWSRPEPFVQVATANPKEKIRYVAFDKLGHKLITGIANSPQTRWERVRAPVPVPRQAERSASPYRTRITPRLVNTQLPQEREYFNVGIRNEGPSTSESTREVVSSVPERERRITASYRNLLREYEQLVQRYLKVYKPPKMIDRGTDPMETNTNSTTSSTQAPESTPGPSGLSNTSTSENVQSDPQPSTSQNYSSSLVMPSRILAMKKQPILAHSTQTSDSRKHKSCENSEDSTREKRSRCDDSSSSSHTETATQTQSPRRVLVINDRSPQGEASSSQEKPVRNSGVRILCPKTLKRKLPDSFFHPPASSSSEPQPSTSRGQSSSDGILSNIRPIAEEVRNRFLPIIKALPACDRPKLIRRFENSRAQKFRQICPTFSKKPNRRPVLDTSSDSSSSDDERSTLRTRLGLDSNNSSNQNGGNTGNDQEQECAHTAARSSDSNIATTRTSSTTAASNISGVRNFIMELEQLLMTVLLTEIEGGSDGQNPNNNTDTSATLNVPTVNSPTNLTNSLPSNSNNQEEEPQSSGIRSSPVYISANRDQDLIRPSAVALGNSIFRRLIQRHENSEQTESRTATSNSDETSRSSSVGNNNTYSRTSSPIYSRTYPRRRLSAHRISAFMPTRVNYNRTSMRYRRGTSFRLGSRLSYNNTFPIDEIINYSERPNAEDNLPQDNQQPDPTPLDSQTESPVVNLDNMYSNIVQDLESSLNDVRNIRSSSRPSDTSDMLSSFSESLENIMNQSDTILRNLGGSMSLLPNYSDTEAGRSSRDLNEPRVSFDDQNFYVRSNSEASTSNDLRSLNAVLRGGRSVVESDHNYPRNPGNNQTQNSSENISPLMTSLHLTISYIQRQARLLRQQVESIERIDRTMFEVEQLQLIRQLIMEFLRYVRSLAGESRSTGMSSVRQMMAGTRISDSSPYDSQSEESNQPTPQPSTASTSTNNEQTQPRPRSSGRKTYPPSRLFRLQRHNRRSLFVNFFPRRYTGRPERGMKHSAPSRSAPSRTPQETSNPLRHLSSYSLINSSSLNLMARRLEHLLTEQTRLITRPQEISSQSNRPSASTELGERILSIRLHDCVMRMNRIMGTGLENSRFRNARADNVVVTQDGASRFGARHFLSLIVDGMSKHMEELGGSNVSQSMRGQIHSVLAMALLLSDLLLLQLVDSIPPPAGMNLDVERESLTSRIDQMCGQMLQNRFSGHSHQLTRSLQHMRLTMRHAYRALGQTYNARRNAMMPNRQDYNRRQLLNRYLRNLNRRRQMQNMTTVDQTNSSSDPVPRDTAISAPSTSAENTLNDNVTRGWGSLRDLIMRYSDNTGEEEDLSNSNSTQDNRERSQRVENVSSNNSDDNDDESEWYVNSNPSRNTNLYRTNNVNLVHNSEESSSSSHPSRPWNVPTVQVNDVPISEQPSLFYHRMLSHRQRLAERLPELRSFPQMSVLRPRFLHPLYASVNPFDADLDDAQRETNYDCDIATVTPNHRIQVWDMSTGNIPVINNPLKNIIVSECKIHNDASVDIAKDGTILVTLLPSGGYLNVTNKLGVYSLKWDTLGQCLYTTSFEQNAVSVALSPLSRHLVVGLASRRVSIVPSDRWTMARIFIIDQKNVPGDRLPVLRELGQNRDSRATNYKSVNCIRWLPTSGQGLIYATNTGQLVILT